MSRCVFYVAVIGGRHFEGILSGDGPYIACGNEGVALGTCASIEPFWASAAFRSLAAWIRSRPRRRGQ